jgi:hypothetical protein
MPALTGGAYGWPWGQAVVPVVPVAAVPVGSVCTITTHRRCLATQSIRRRLGGRTNINLTAPRASQTLVRTGTLKETDFIGSQTYKLADGSTMPSATFSIRSLAIGDEVVENVIGGIAPVQGTLLLGQSFLSRFKSWSIDNARHVLTLEP